jgi:hypothetical protein
VARELRQFFVSQGIATDRIELRSVDAYLANTGSTSTFAVSSVLEKLLEPYRTAPQQVGLFYTGGTKSMAVHAYRAIEKAITNPNRRIFSYLHPTRHVLLFDPNQPGRRTDEFPLHGLIRLPLAKLCAMQGMPWRAPDVDYRTLDAAGDALRGMHCFDPSTDHAYEDVSQAIKAWKNWVEKGPARGGDPTLDFADQGNAKLDAVLAALRAALKLNSGSTTVTLGAAAEAIGIAPQKLRDWFGSTWIETTVARTLQELADEGDITLHDVTHSFHAFRKEQPNEPEWRDSRFEADVVAISGYQLFYITCTTSTKKAEAKEKLLEAHVRARQLGGDEARVALVTAFDAKTEPNGSDMMDKLSTELESLFPNSSARIVPANTWTNLRGELRQWIQENTTAKKA